ncbi:hypothetical protein CYMTET_17521, partial [Cymbomonas tetramitiformis]
VCADGSGNLNNGTNGFDNILIAVYTIFQMLTLNGWEAVMYALIDTTGQLSILYILVVILSGAITVMNLALAVIHDSYTNCKGQVEAMQIEEAKLKIELKIVQQSKEKISQQVASSHAQGVAAISQRKATVQQNPFLLPDHIIRWLGLYLDQPQLCSRKWELARLNTYTEKMKEEDRSQCCLWMTDVVCTLPGVALRAKAAAISGCKRVWLARPRTKHTRIQRLSQWCKGCVEHPYTQNWVTFLVILNVALLCLFHHNQPKTLTLVIHWVSLISVVFFALEIVLQILNLGLWRYFSDIFNVLDFLVVALSILDYSGILSGLGAGGVVIRLTRVMRALNTSKLGMRWPRFKHFCRALATAMDSIWPFLYIMGSFIMVMALFGKELFEDTDFGDTHQYHNYSTLGGAILVTFQ